MKHGFIKIPSAITENVCKSLAYFALPFPMLNDSSKAAFAYVPLILLASSLVISAADLKTVDDFRGAAAKANAVLTIPDWEKKPEAIEAAMRSAIAKANAALDQIGAQDPGKVTFKSTVAALDDVTYEANLAANRATLIK